MFNTATLALIASVAVGSRTTPVLRLGEVCGASLAPSNLGAVRRLEDALNEFAKPGVKALLAGVTVDVVRHPT